MLRLQVVLEMLIDGRLAGVAAAVAGSNCWHMLLMG
jgi:hypothetical protein